MPNETDKPASPDQQGTKLAEVEVTADAFAPAADANPPASQRDETGSLKRGEWITFNPPERRRIYHYPDGKAWIYHAVTRLRVSQSGNHYVETADGLHAIIAPGWRVIELDIDQWTA